MRKYISEVRPPKISVVMPALNEEANIAQAINSCLAAFSQYGLKGEIVVVDDGSQDKTKEVVKAIMRAEERIRLIIHPAPRGIGASFWAGFRGAGGDAVVMIPGDNENELSQIIRHIGLLRDVDMVVPFVRNKDVRSGWRNLLSGAYTFILNATFGMSLKYFNGTVLYKKSLLDNIGCASKGFFFQAEILIKALKNGCLFAEVPYSIRKRAGGDAKAVSFFSLCDVAGCYLRLITEIGCRR